MARAPLNVLVFPFRQTAGRLLEYAVFRRADEDVELWQGVAGGAETGEDALQAARRELVEETGLSPEQGWISLDAMATVPRDVFRDWKSWGRDVYVVVERAFGVDVGSQHVRLSHEHSAYRWLSFSEASALLRWDSNRTALWELNERLTSAREPEASDD